MTDRQTTFTAVHTNVALRLTLFMQTEHMKCELSTVSSASINCEEFAPGMFVNLLIFIESKERCEIELVNEKDKLLTVQPDYTEQRLLLGSHIAGKEHREAPVLQLDKGGGMIQLTISAEANSFDIFVNKEKYYSYQYREDVRTVKTIRYTGSEQTKAAMSVGRTLLGLNHTTVRAVYIQARAPEGGTFAIDFVSSFQPNYIKDDIPFHMSIRFNDGKVSRNAKINETWKRNGDRDGGMPFTPGKDFSVIVFAQQGTFEVAVNQDHFTKFTYRMQFIGELSVQLRNVAYVKKIAYH